MKKLPAILRELHHGSSTAALRARAGMVAFDLMTISYFVVTTFLPELDWIVGVDLAIGVVLTIELLTRVIAERDRVGFLLRPMTVIDMLIIASLLAPAMIGSFVFLRVLRALRLIRSYYVLRELRERFQFFDRNEDVIFSAINLFVFIFVVTAVVYELQVATNPDISNYVDALYFTITTLTTTGFGDIILIGTTGRLLAVVIMIVGVTLFIRLVQTIFRPRKVRFNCPDCGLSRHDTDAVHCKHCGRVLHIVSEGA